MPAFREPFNPVAYPNQAIRLEPSNTVYKVKSLEQMARIGPVDFGAATSGNKASESGSNIIDLEDEVEMKENALGQFLLNPLSLVEVELRQTGDQDQRFINKNTVGKITPHDPPNQRLFWTWEDNAPRVIIENPQTYDMEKTLIYLTGFKYVVGSDPLSDREIRDLAGEPASVPVDSLKKTPDEAVN